MDGIHYANLAVYGLQVILLFVVILVRWTFGQRLYQEKLNIKQKYALSLLEAFAVLRVGWAVLLLYNANVAAMFFLDATGTFAFYVAFGVVFFHLWKKITGWSVRKSRVGISTVLLLYVLVYVFIVVVTILMGTSIGTARLGSFLSDNKGSEVIMIVFTLSSAAGTGIIGFILFYNVAGLDQRKSIDGESPIKNRHIAVLIMGSLILLCLSMLIMRVVVFFVQTAIGYKLDSAVSAVLGYWLPESVILFIMWIVMRRTYKAHSSMGGDSIEATLAVLAVDPARSVMVAGELRSPERAIYSPPNEMSRMDSGSSPIMKTRSEDFYSSLGSRRNQRARAGVSDQGGFNFDRPMAAELSVVCSFPIKMKPMVLLMPHQKRPSVMSSSELINFISEHREIDRTETVVKHSTQFIQFARTLSYITDDFDKPFWILVMNLGEADTSGTQTLQFIGELLFSGSEFLRADDFKATKTFYWPPDATTQNCGSITLRLELMEPYIADPRSIVKGYLFYTEDNRKIHLREELRESNYVFDVPIQLLKILIPQRKAELVEMEKHLFDLAKTPRVQTQHGFGNDMIGDLMTEISQDNDQQFQTKWYGGLVEGHRAHVRLMEDCLKLYRNLRDHPDGVKFKSSTQKADPDFTYISTNLHEQELGVYRDNMIDDETGAMNPPEIIARYPFVTFGAPAAHTFKFKHGLRDLQERRQKVFDQLRTKSTMKRSERKQFATLSRALEEMDLEIRQRYDIVLSQAASALVTSIARMIAKCSRSDPAALQQIANVGFLFHVESLLSTHGSELGMINDMSVAIKSLKMFSFQVVDASQIENTLQFVRRDAANNSALDESIPVFDATHLKVLIKLPVSASVYAAAPEAFKTGRIRIFPVLFTQGINEQQTLANTVGDSSLQEEINNESFDILNEYYKTCIKYFMSTAQVNLINNSKMTAKLEEARKQILQSRREKNVNILAKTADFARSVNAGRATCCKSAKDRTSMSITWEQVRLLQENHNIAASSVFNAIGVMRSAGVRRENAYKNIGVDKFAFNNFQLMMIPEIYRAPKGTQGAHTN